MVAPPPPLLWRSRKRPAPPSAHELVDFYCELVGTSTGTTSSPSHGQRDRETLGQTDCGTEGTNDSSRVCPQGGANRTVWKNLEALFSIFFGSSTNIVHKNIWWLFWCERSTQSFLVSAVSGFQNVSDIVRAPT